MLLGYFTEDAYNQLHGDISKNTDFYSGNTDWLNQYFGRADYYKNSSVEVNKFTPWYTAGRKTDAQKCQEDLVNTRLLHTAFQKLTPLQATNKYMWTYLCHAIPEYSTYIRDRWMQEVRENTIETRFFVTNPDSLLNDNALSRLWWYGHLTYDINNGNRNPYELTEILLTNQTICTDVIDTLNRMNFGRIKGVLLAIRDFKEELSANEGISDYFRECKKYLNHYAAVTKMEFLEPEEIRDLAFNYMMSLKEEKNSGNLGPKSMRKPRQ